MEVKHFLRLYRFWQYRRTAYQFGLLAHAERLAKEKAQLAVTN